MFTRELAGAESSGFEAAKRSFANKCVPKLTWEREIHTPRRMGPRETYMVFLRLMGIMNVVAANSRTAMSPK